MKLFLDPAEPGCCVILHLWDAGAWRPQQELQCDLLCVQLRRPCKFPGFRQRKMKWRTWFCPPEKLTGPTFSKQQSRKDWAKPLEICWKMTILWAREKKKHHILIHISTDVNHFFFVFPKKGRILIKVFDENFEPFNWSDSYLSQNSNLLNTFQEFLIGNGQL